MEKTAAKYPLRVASVDMGSNAIRFYAAEFQNQTQYSGLLFLERWVLQGKSRYFSNTFGVQVKFRIER
ncbi:MAG: hypothetical protein AMS17_00580 [Spirochaetes bacterium DG_61]|nr:MAG: hypothetical protein AMS17_00580 [Spirochaetes bacterium DG_61]